LGVPRADGSWGNCDPKEKKNYRTRCSAFIKSNIKNILIDTSPDLRHQLIKNKINNIDYVIYSHKHGDQVHGINDLRVFSLKNKKKISVYADYQTGKYIKNNFSYCFKNTPSYKAILKLYNLKKRFSFKKNGNFITIKSIAVQHGEIKSQSFIINKSCAYISDANKIYNKDLKYFKNLNYLVIDCLRFNKHPSHFNLNEVIELTKLLKPKKTVLTNLHSDLDYKYMLKILPKNIIPGYDGMSFYI
jgi:phosphoribosyl 1,2-cyclic phosphate phosphodiesterase